METTHPALLTTMHRFISPTRFLRYLALSVHVNQGLKYSLRTMVYEKNFLRYPISLITLYVRSIAIQ
jgi:hypothetical protein